MRENRFWYVHWIGSVYIEKKNENTPFEKKLVDPGVFGNRLYWWRNL